MKTESIIKTLRDIRQQHAASFDYDLDRIFADLKSCQAKHVTEGWTVSPAPSASMQLSAAAPQRTRFARTSI
jgi:hypothetical protein